MIPDSIVTYLCQRCLNPRPKNKKCRTQSCVQARREYRLKYRRDNYGPPDPGQAWFRRGRTAR